jgi:Tol biopolymer transport system component
MKQTKKNILWLVAFLGVGTIGLCAEPFAEGPYLGQTPPGATAQVFAPGLISRTGHTWESNGTFSMDGKVFLYLSDTSHYLTENTDQGWSMPTRVTGMTGSVVWSPTISPDGNSIYYSNRNLMRMDRTPQGWTVPQNLGSPLSSSANEWGFSLAADNSFYFCSHRSGGRGGCDVWHAPFIDNTWPQAYNITALNTSSNECDPEIAPDESFMVFHSPRPGGLGRTDLYLSLRQPDDTWTSPRNLGPRVNSTQLEFASCISPDKKYLFFTRSSGWDPRIHTADIYWVELKEYLPDPNGPMKN